MFIDPIADQRPETMKSIPVLILICLYSLFLQSQEESGPVNRLGLRVEYGLGGVALVDHYISKERYTGTIQDVVIGYGRLDEKKGFQLSFTNQFGDELENHAIKAEFSRASLDYDQFFNLRAFSLFNKPANWYFGPSAGYFEYNLINRFTSTHKVISELTMVSVGINSMVDWQPVKKLNVCLFFRTNVFGVNSKTHDDRRYPDKENTFQLLFAANNINAELSAGYLVLKRLSLGITGKGQYTRSSGWDESQNFINSLLLFTVIHF